MRPVLLLTAATLSVPPTVPPHDSIHAAIEYAIAEVADRVVPRVTLAPREPTIPSPPGGGAAARPPRRVDHLSFEPYRLPVDLLVDGGQGTIAENPRTMCSIVAPRRADVLAIYDAAAGDRADAIRASGLRLRLVAEPALSIAPHLVEEVISTMLDVAVAASSDGGRVDLVTREHAGRASITVSLVSSRYSSIRERQSARSGDVRNQPELAARLEGCRSILARAGGTLEVDSDEEHTTVQAVVPVDDDAEEVDHALCA